ncbi:MAG: hypothetical protein ACRDB0_04525 [Paraclostridium sp.]
MDKYVIEINGNKYLTMHIIDREIINCNNIDWCSKNCECVGCVFDHEAEDYEPRTLKDLKHKKLEDVLKA